MKYGLIVFDYNNAGDEVLVSDLVMEGLLTAYEMDLPDGIPASYRKALFPAFLKGYLTEGLEVEYYDIENRKTDHPAHCSGGLEKHSKNLG